MNPNLRQQKAIGVFDSGIGGLTVVRAIMERLPHENMVYFGDTARVPYGVKSRNTIELFSEQIVTFLLQQDVKALVIACNSIAAVAGEKVRHLAGNMPVLDVIEAGSKAAAAATTNRQVGIIATTATVNSNAYARAIARYNPHIRVLSQACPLFVPLVEEGWLNHAVSRLTAREYLSPILAEKIDTLVLGCTHYPLLKPLLREEAQGVELIDSAMTTADALAAALSAAELLNNSTKNPDYRFYVSDIPLRFQTIGERFLGRSLEQVEMFTLA